MAGRTIFLSKQSDRNGNLSKVAIAPKISFFFIEISQFIKTRCIYFSLCCKK